MARQERDRLLATLDDVESQLGGLKSLTAAMYRAIKHPEWFGCRAELPLLPLTFWPAVEPTDDDLALCERLQRAYSLAASDGAASASDLWDSIIEQHHKSLLLCLQEPTPLPLAKLLSSMFTQDFMWGITSGSAFSEISTKADSVIWSLSQLDNLLSLAEAAGVVRTENPEQGVKGYAFEDGIQALVARVEASLGVQITFPNVGAPYGLEIGGRIVTADTPEHTYAAMRIEQAMRLVGVPTEPTVVEIGAGFGGTAFRLLKTRAVSRYTIIDLPIVNVLQGYFLSKALGAEAVSLYGESSAKVEVLPTYLLKTVGDVDVLINENSMPEMPESVVDEYLSWAKRHVRGFFFSYNQEAYSPVHGVAQVLVPAAVARVGGFELVSRVPSWIRRGYVEEVYRPKSGPETMDDNGEPDQESVLASWDSLGYTPLFEQWFGSIRQDPLRILEIGLHDPRMAGVPLEGWCEYFPNARVFGFGIMAATRFDNDRTTTFVGDQADVKDLARFIEEYGGEFDIIVDAGSRHVGEYQQVSLGFLFEHVKHSGQYILQASPSTKQLMLGLQRRVGEQLRQRTLKDGFHKLGDMVTSGRDAPEYLSREAITRLSRQIESVELVCGDKLARIVRL